MKLFAIVALLASSACTFSNSKGECLGFDDEPKAGLTYEVSTYNAVVTAIGFEMVWPIFVWALECVRCPVED